MVVCEVKRQNKDHNQTHITVAGSQIWYPGDLGTPTGSLDLVKLIINSVLSRRNSRFVYFDLEFFYLQTPMEQSEYVRIKLSDIPQEFIEEYNLTRSVQNGWIYFEILRGCYGLPQWGRLANDLLHTRLEKAGYYEAATTPGLWSHKWRPIQFVLIVDDLGIKYVGKHHALHLIKILEQNYEITTDWEGKKCTGIDLAWDYNDHNANRTWQISMSGYIENMILKYWQPHPSKAQLSPHNHREVIYGAKEQPTHEDDKSPPLDNQGKKSIQGIVGALLYYVRAVEKNLLVGLSSIGSQQAATTERTKEAINKLLVYCATYSADGILYRSSNMVLCAHSDTGFHN